MNNKTIIKKLFKEKAFQFIWLAKIIEIAPDLIFDDVKKNTDSEGGWLLIFHNKVGNKIEFIATDDPNDLDYGDNLGIYDTSRVALADELQMNGTFLGGPTNFSYSDNKRTQQLKKALDKFAKLK